MIKKRTTIYLDGELVKMLKIRSIKSEQSMSEYISQVVYQDMMEEQKDLMDVHKVLKEPSIPFAEVLKKLKLEKDV